MPEETGLYDRLMEEQEGCCAICRRDLPLKVDHNHTTHKMRGLLCNNCNVGIGLLGDNLVLLRRAVRYLKEYEE